MLKPVRREIRQPDYTREEIAPGVVEYHKDLGQRALYLANALVILAVILPCVLLMILIVNYSGPVQDNYFLLSLTLITFVTMYALVRYQQHLRAGIPANLIRIDTRQQLLTVGLDEDQQQFRFDEIQDILLLSRGSKYKRDSIIPSPYSFCIDLWTTDDEFYPLMEPIWQIDVPVKPEYEQMARDIAQDIRDLIRQALILSKSKRQTTAPQPAVLVEEHA